MPSDSYSLFCCPIRYGRSAKTSGLFLADANSLEMPDASCFQAVLVLLLERFLQLGIIAPPPDQALTERECMCLDLYSRGNDISAIAIQLDRPEQDIAASLNVAGSRLRAHNFAHAVAIAIRSELI